MKNKILILTLLILSCLWFGVSAQDAPVTATGGTVVINAEFAGEKQGTPVLIVVLPEITDPATQEDITMSMLPVSNDAATIINSLKGSGLSVEYIDVCLTGETGNINLTCKMRDNLSTGNCHVYAKRFKSLSWEKIGDFQHVGQDDVNNLLDAFNGVSSGYKSTIENDINGKKLLEKSSANVAFYESIMGKTPDFTGEFCTVLAEKKPEGGFDILSLVDAFNEACAWIELRTADDVSSVLAEYNDKYWSLPITDDEYTELSEEEKEKIFLVIKSEKGSDGEKLAEIFEKELALSVFRSIATREDLEELIAEGSKFGAYFAEVRELIEDADISDYQKLNVFNDVLEENSKIQDFDDISDLFDDSIDSLDSGKSSSKGGGGSSSGGKKVSSNASIGSAVYAPAPNMPVVSEKAEFPFKDVDEASWSYEYIKRLYDEKVINGVSETEFLPNNSITRQDFVKILVGALDVELSLNDSVFTDLPVGCYYEPYIMAAMENGLISGLGDGSFGMGRNITREDAALIVSRVLKDVDSDKEISFKDAHTVSDYAKDGVIKAAQAGIFSGDDNGNFNPAANLSRAEACAILSRLADRVKGGTQ